MATLIDDILVARGVVRSHLTTMKIDDNVFVGHRCRCHRWTDGDFDVPSHFDENHRANNENVIVARDDVMSVAAIVMRIQRCRCIHRWHCEWCRRHRRLR